MILHSKILGEGTPLIILHGLFGMGENWISIAKRLSSIFEVHLVDQRNHGRSFHKKNFSYQLLAEDLYQYIEYYKLKKCNIIGHSLGGKTAMFFGSMFEHKVQKMVIVDIAPKPYSIRNGEMPLIILNRLSNLKELVSRKQVDKDLSVFVKDKTLRQFLLKNLFWNEDNKLQWRFNLPAFQQEIQNIYKGLKKHFLYNKPILFLKGEKSNYIQEKDKVKIIKHFPKATIKTILNSGHWIHFDNPDSFYSELIKFIKPS